jgi:hypothetical protein
MDEPIIVINGHRLHTGHAMTVRVALQTFAFSLKDEGMGDDEHGRRMTQHYLAAIEAINEMMQGQGDE